MMKRTGIGLLAACALASTFVSSAGADSATQAERKLVGTWDIRNETVDPNYGGRKTTGQVTFAADRTLTIDAGAFAAAGIVHGSERGICFRPQAPVSFKVLGTSAKQKLYVSWMGQARKKPKDLHPQDSMLDVIKLTRNEAILVGQGGCGAVGASRISYLTRVR